MTKKIGPGWDARRDADEGEESSEGFRVDRVFVESPTRPSRSALPAKEITPRPIRGKPSTSSPIAPRTISGAAGGEADTELALRRQLSRLQRQLADAQRELANKDDELAAEAENRLAITNEHDQLVAETLAKVGQLDELLAYRSRTQGVEQRLQETTQAADALARERDEERDQRVAAQARAKELEAALADAQARWAAERTALEDAYGNEIGRLELEKKTAAESAESTLAATTGRLQKAQEEQLVQLRESHEKSVALLRGQLEPKALEIRTLAEERSRLTDQLEALKVEMTRALAERDEAHARELAQQVESNSAGQAAAARAHASELARVVAERDNANAALEQAKQSAIDREKLVDQTVTALRDAQKQLQREAAEAKEAVARLTADNTSLADRLAAANHQAASLTEDVRDLRAQLDVRDREARQAALDRQRFVAYLEEGMALLGALPPETITMVAEPGTGDAADLSFKPEKPDGA